MFRRLSMIIAGPPVVKDIAVVSEVDLVDRERRRGRLFGPRKGGGEEVEKKKKKIRQRPRIRREKKGGKNHCLELWRKTAQLRPPRRPFWLLLFRCTHTHTLTHTQRPKPSFPLLYHPQTIFSPCIFNETINNPSIRRNSRRSGTVLNKSNLHIKE